MKIQSYNCCMRCLLLAESHRFWNPETSLELKLLERLLAQEIPVALLDLQRIVGTVDPLALPIRTVLFADHRESCFLGLDALNHRPHDDFDCLLIGIVRHEQSIIQPLEEIFRARVVTKNLALSVDELKVLRLKDRA